MPPMATTIDVGLTTTVLGDRFRSRAAASLSDAARAAWWKRTDYAWVCSACPDTAGVNYNSARGAHLGAQAHAAAHPGAIVETAKTQQSAEQCATWTMTPDETCDNCGAPSRAIDGAYCSTCSTDCLHADQCDGTLLPDEGSS